MSGNGSSYKCYLTHNYKVAHEICSLLGKQVHDEKEYWHWSCCKVLRDCRIPSLYHDQGYYMALLEHNNGDWNKTPTYEMIILD